MLGRTALLRLGGSHLASPGGSMPGQQQTNAVTAVTQRRYVALMGFDDAANCLQGDMIPPGLARNAQGLSMFVGAGILNYDLDCGRASHPGSGSKPYPYVATFGQIENTVFQAATNGLGQVATFALYDQRF